MVDEKTEDAIGGGIVGGTIGGLVGGPPGALIGGVIGSALGSRERKHNEALRKTFYELKEATDGSGKLHVDHIDPEGAEPGGTRSLISDVNGDPDLVLIAQRYSNLVIEVETVEGIENDEEHVIGQLNDFQTQGFKRVLVVPESDLEDVYGWVEAHEERGDINSEVKIATPNRISNLI